jgi:hypothetical protein
MHLRRWCRKPVYLPSAVALLAGDSRAVVLADGRVVAHTEEHRAHREDEQVSKQGSASSTGSIISCSAQLCCMAMCCMLCTTVVASLHGCAAALAQLTKQLLCRGICAWLQPCACGEAAVLMHASNSFIAVVYAMY